MTSLLSELKGITMGVIGAQNRVQTSLHHQGDGVNFAGTQPVPLGGSLINENFFIK